MIFFLGRKNIKLVFGNQFINKRRINLGWTTGEIKFLKNAYDHMPAKEIGELLGKSERAVGESG